METGWYGSLWKHTFNRFSKYTSNHSLIYYACQYNASHGIHIEVIHHAIRSKRKGDMAIMDLVTQYYTNTSQLRKIQKVRMELGVVHVSDICSADGHRLDNRFLSNKMKSVVCNNDSWPVKHNVNKQDHTMWNKLLKRIFSGTNTSLITPLREWIKCDQHTWFTECDFFLSDNREFLYHQYKHGVW